MSARPILMEYDGEWSGINQLWVRPEDPVRQSEASASIELAANDCFALIKYTWSDLGEPQDGVLLVRLARDLSPLDMVWIDSWHTGGKFMEFRGEEGQDGCISALGSYPAPPGPDWGWRIILAADSNAAFQIIMYNISPDGDEALAVRAQFTRVIAAQQVDAADRSSARR